MRTIEHSSFEGERPLFKQRELLIRDSEFLPGESAIKEGREITALRCRFSGKYPFWHNHAAMIQECSFMDGSRAAIWYSSDVTMRRCQVEAPKMFRDARRITIEQTTIDGHETLWDCSEVTISDSHFTGNYLLLHGSDIDLTRFVLDGDYSFQHVKRGAVRDSVINSKDAFWNTEDITVYDSVLQGEYLGWYSKNLRLVRCRIIGTQPLCYAQNLILEDCELVDTDLCFEDSTVQADLRNIVDSVKNPISGVIRAPGIRELILDDPERDFSDLTILTPSACECGEGRACCEV
jgi:hypothetical protein